MAKSETLLLCYTLSGLQGFFTKFLVGDFRSEMIRDVDSSQVTLTRVRLESPFL